MSGPDARRERMVDRQLVTRGVRDVRVLDAMRQVPREMFVTPRLEPHAYEDGPLPIEEGQTISQPYVVALMVEALDLRGGERVLEIGTGSGYETAVLARLARRVYTVERHASLVATARDRFARLGLRNIEVRHGDGTEGWPEHAPFDAIVVSAGGPEVPASLREQLAIGGRLVIPVGKREAQRLLRIVRRDTDRFTRTSLGAVRFVPLVGAEGWPSDQAEGVGGGVAGAGPSRSSRLSRALRTVIPRRSRSSRDGT